MLWYCSIISFLFWRKFRYRPLFCPATSPRFWSFLRGGSGRGTPPSPQCGAGRGTPPSPRGGFPAGRGAHPCWESHHQILKNYSKCEEEKCMCMYKACVVQQICLTITPGWMPGLIKISLLPVNAIIKDNGSEIYTILKSKERKEIKKTKNCKCCLPL